MKIAMIGGAGFVGSHLTRAYLNAGHDVFVIDSLVHGAREAIDPRARFYHLDIRDGKLRAVLQAERPEIVSHHAVQREHTLPCEGSLIDADVHIRGLLNVLEACVDAQVAKLIFASGGNSLYRRCPLQGVETSMPVSEEIEAVPGTRKISARSPASGMFATIHNSTACRISFCATRTSTARPITRVPGIH